MKKSAKEERLKEIRELVVSFCDEHLNEELQGYALKLCDTLGRKRKISIVRGKKEIWAASIIYVIARLNFLFDPENDLFLTADTVCDFFGTRKATIGNKATQIEKACNLGMGAEGFCSPEISEELTLVELPNGLVIPKSMMSKLDFLGSSGFCVPKGGLKGVDNQVSSLAITTKQGGIPSCPRVFYTMDLE